MATLKQLFQRLWIPAAQTRAARSVELFGWIDLILGLILFLAPDLAVALLRLPPLTEQGANYLRLAGLLVSGLGMLYIVSGRLNADGFIFASLLDRPVVPAVMASLWYFKVLPGRLALAFAITDFGGFLWTLFAWRADARFGQTFHPGWAAGAAAEVFGFASGVLRNARTFHPDGRVFRGSVRSLNPPDAALEAAALQLEGPALMRIGMGVMKKGMPRWLADRIADAPSIATRFLSDLSPGLVRLERRPGADLDLLCTAGGDRLWKLIVNLGTGGRRYGLHQFDYFQNLYSADVPYRVGSTRYWIRLVPSRGNLPPTGPAPQDGAAREEGLSNAVARHAVIRIEAQRVRLTGEPFIPFAEIRFEEEIQLDQEALHFDPVAGRGFTPYGFLTDLRTAVYPASVQSRPGSASERAARDRESMVRRWIRFLLEPVPGVTPDRAVANATPRVPAASSASSWSWKRLVFYAGVAVVVIVALFGVGRFMEDRPVIYADNELHFKHGSTGGERLNGIPYWIWVALPELFPEYLPDRKPGRGYSSLGMIYENGEDPRYALPVGVSMRNVMGIDRVYLNCAVCHTGVVRKEPGGPALVVSGMPANTFNLGAWGKFLTSLVLNQKFTPQRLVDQIGLMQNDSHRAVDKPDFINRLLIKYAIPYLMRDSLIVLGQRLAFIDTSTWGPGRVDTFNAPKALLNFNMSNADPSELIGNVDFPSIWNQGPREGMQLHWDGNNTSVNERNLSAAFGTGAYPPTLDVASVLRTAKWLETNRPPPFPFQIDEALASRGEPIYQRLCASCHGTREPPFRHNPPMSGERVGTVVPLEAIGTDPWRLNSYTWLLAVNQSTLYAGFERDWGFNQPYPQRFTHFRKTPGYANSPLDGIWLRAPYLHNGSVPNLRELLEPAGARTKVFYRGNDVYDPADVGFVSTISEQNGQRFFAFDTSKPGNGNLGHEGPAYGTELTSEEKRALLEYLKKF